MTKKEMSTESVSLNASPARQLTASQEYDRDRMQSYATFAAAFSYPDEKFFENFPQPSESKERMISDYDKLFRAGTVWLYCTEYMATNEFQRAKLLSDIMGFYMAFGLEPDKDRPDSIACEMEFMNYLIFKRDRIGQGLVPDDPQAKADLCRDAEKKFFSEHLEPSAQLIAEKIIAKSDNSFYVQAATDLIEFLAAERKHFNLTDASGEKKRCEKVSGPQ